jgi:hypothetical protein
MDKVASSHAAKQLRSNAFAFEMFQEDREQLFALIAAIDRDLGVLCNEGKEDMPEDAPLNVWRLSQLAVRQLGSMRLNLALKQHLGLEEQTEPLR